MNGPAVCCPACGHALFTVDEPAWPILAISRSSLYQLMSAGAVQTVRLARTVRIPRREMERLEDGAGHETPKVFASRLAFHRLGAEHQVGARGDGQH